MLDQIFNDCKKQLSAALKHKKHAFRFFTLASKNLNENINLRTVVLRDFDPEQMTFTIFTDARSKKVKELNENSHSQFLFYDSKRMIQLLILSKVKEIHHQESTYNIILLLLLVEHFPMLFQFHLLSIQRAFLFHHRRQLLLT